MSDKEKKAPIAAFAAYGIEIEYMIVDRETLKVRPISDELLKAASGNLSGDHENGRITWSNELVLHVIELKTSGPDRELATLAPAFQKNVREINRRLAPTACLLPTGMHPFMAPQEKKLWPHDNNEIYEAYDRIFDCRGHGWSNLQSTHINLPFADDEEFARLHTAIRLILPALPALTASSPIVEGERTGFADTRLHHYQQNQKLVPSIAGLIVPEPVLSKAEYQEKILSKIYADIAPHDPEALLRDDWLNSRGAIARFGRQTIEIRILDTQECPAIDLAIVEFTVAVIKQLCEGSIPFADQLAPKTESLKRVFDETIRKAETASLDSDYLKVWGLRGPMLATEFWKVLWERHGSLVSASSQTIIPKLLNEGSLATRMLKAATRTEIPGLYRKLADCLEDGTFFSP